MLTLAAIFSSLVFAYSFALPTPDDYLITSLPLYNGSFSEIPFKQYAGFMPIGDESDTHLFFWFVESQRSPSTDPLMLWTNGLSYYLCSKSNP